MMKQKKVLQVCAYGADYGGNFIASLEALEENLLKEGYQTIYAFVQRAEDKAWCREIQKRTKVYFLPEAKARILPKTYAVFRSIYRENDIAVVHSHFELYDIPATVMAPKNTQVFWHLHDPITLDHGLRRILWKTQYGVVGKRAHLLAVTEKYRDLVVQLGFPKNQTYIIRNAIDLDRIGDCRSIPDTPYVFLMFGWDVLRKGVDLVVAASQAITEGKIEIHVVGMDPCKEYLKQNPTNTIQSISPVSDVGSLYKSSNAFLHVSRSEGLSYALLEAIYAGLPVICSDIPENMFAREFKGIRFVPVGDAEAINVAMKELAEKQITLSDEDFNFNRHLIQHGYSLPAWAKTVAHLYFSGE